MIKKSLIIFIILFAAYFSVNGHSPILKKAFLLVGKDYLRIENPTLFYSKCSKARKNFVSGSGNYNCKGEIDATTFRAFEMLLLKRTDNSYFVVLNSTSYCWDTTYFFEYKNNKIKDITDMFYKSRKGKIFELDKKNNVIKVFQKVFEADGRKCQLYEESVDFKKGRHLYNLVFKNNKLETQRIAK